MNLKQPRGTQSRTQRGPTRGQLLSMAFVDGELAPAARRRVGDLLLREPTLLRHAEELTALKTLLDSVGPVHGWSVDERPFITSSLP